MTTPLPSYGTLKMSDLLTNMEIPAGTQVALSDQRLRALAGKKTGSLKLSDFYGMNELEGYLKAGLDDNGNAIGFYNTFWGEIDRPGFDSYTLVGAYDNLPDSTFVLAVAGNAPSTAFHAIIINSHIYYEADALTFTYDAGSDTTIWTWTGMAGLAQGTIYELSYCVGTGPVAPPAATVPVGQGTDWTLVFEDTFTSGTLDSTKWNRAQWYLLDDPASNPAGFDNFDFSGGRLRIWPAQHNGIWVKRDLTTYGHFAQAYGYWEIKCKMPINTGIRCTFWLMNHDTDARPILSPFAVLPGNTVASGWVDASNHCIDFATFIQPTTDGQVLSSIRYKDIVPAMPAIDLSNADHVFGIKKDSSGVDFFLDGVLVQHQDLLGPNVMTLDQYMIVTLDYNTDGPAADGSTIQDATAAFEVDYVRAWTPGAGTGGGGGGGNPVPSGYTAPVGKSQQDYPYMTFREEFDGASIDSTKWNQKLPNQTANGKANISVANSIASLWPAAPFASGSVDFNATLSTDIKFYQKYGYFEMRAKLPTGKGVWPGFFLFNSDLTGVRPEIAIMEAYPGATTPSIAAPSMASLYDTRLVTDEFWGMHMSAPSIEPWPLLQFKTYRTWDAYPGISWADINTASGTYNWTNLDAVMTAAAPHNVDLVYTFGYVPTWVNGSQTNAPTDAAWTDFVNAVVARYPQIKYWQIWNEPNSTTFWTGSTAQMVHLASLAAPIIRAAGGIVLSPCPQGANAHTWLNDFFVAGGGAYVDIITFNSYTYNEPETLITNYANLLTVVANNSQTGKEIWDTEHSWGDNTWPFGGSDDLKKAYLARLIVLSHSLGITRSLWYSYDNFTFGSLADRNTDTLLPAGVAYQNLYSWIAGKRMTKHTVTGTVYTIDVSGMDGYRGRIVWDLAGNSVYSGTTGFFRSRTLEGQTFTLSAGQSANIGIKPIIIDNFGSPTSITWGDASKHPIDVSVSAWSKLSLETSLGRWHMSTQMDLSADWHVYGCEWRDGAIAFYVDGVMIGTTILTPANDMNVRMYMLLTVWLGSLSGQADGTTPVGDTNALAIDYVRAWALSDNTTVVEGTLPALPESQGGKSTGGTVPTPTDIVEFYGNSTMWGYKSGVGTQVDIPPPTAFAQRKFYDVRNKAINSTTTDHWINGTNGVPYPWATLMSQSPAKWVCIQFGTLDEFDMTTTVFKDNLKQMCADARTNNIIPILITPFVADFSGLAAYAQAVRDAASEANVGLIELFNWSNNIVQNGTGNIRDYVPDGTHPNDQMYIDGGAEIARVWDTVIGGVVTPPSTGNNPAVPVGHPYTYTEVFSDDFDGSMLDTNVWNTHIWWNANEENVPNWQVANGELYIYPVSPFNPRTIDTDGKFYLTYGFIEMEAKLPRGRGCWPAFWLYNHDGVNGNPDARPEIDIMEAYSGGGPDTGQTWADSNLHPIDFGFTLWKQNNAGVQDKIGDFRMSQYLPNVDLSAGYHKYGCLWEPDGLTLFFDGVQCGPKMMTNFFIYRMYILLDLYFGDASGNPSTAETPTGVANAYRIRYVRAWRKN